MRVVLLTVAVLALAAGLAPVAEASYAASETCRGDPGVVAVCTFRIGEHDCYRVWVGGENLLADRCVDMGA